VCLEARNIQAARDNSTVLDDSTWAAYRQNLRQVSYFVSPISYQYTGHENHAWSLLLAYSCKAVAAQDSTNNAPLFEIAVIRGTTGSEKFIRTRTFRRRLDQLLRHKPRQTAHISTLVLARPDRRTDDQETTFSTFSGRA
jgi:hypothetical protein